MNRCHWIFIVAGVILTCGDCAWAQFERIAKAQPDEIFNGIGEVYVPWGSQAPDAIGQPKVNYDYLWSLTADGPNIWFGTGGNVAAVGAAQVALGGQVVSPQLFESPGGVPFRVWEFGESKYPGVPDPLKTYFGDWRPPRIYHYNALTNKLVDRTPNDPLLNITFGLRSAGSTRGVTLLGGPSLPQVGICLFAFDSATGAFLGSKYIAQYSNIRRWTLAGGELYTSALNTVQNRVRGSVLRWTGNRTGPFDFDVVGHLDNEGAYLTEHDGRLFVGTWASFAFLPLLLGQTPEVPPTSGIWMSPPLGRTGLRRLDVDKWQKVWSPESFEPDDALVGGYSIGAMESYGGQLYWGTMHYPGAGQKYFQAYYGFPPPEPRSNAARRSIVLRAAGWGGPGAPTVELLYGDATLPTFVPDGAESGVWVNMPNRIGPAGIYGTAGFGNSNNFYTWSSAVYQGRLYFGTFDISGVVNTLEVVDGTVPPGTGGDLWMFPAHGSAAVAIDHEGCGNPLNHGIRNMVSTPFGLFLGSANTANLLTGSGVNGFAGGWEFLKLTD